MAAWATDRQRRRLGFKAGPLKHAIRNYLDDDIPFVDQFKEKMIRAIRRTGTLASRRQNR